MHWIASLICEPEYKVKEFARAIPGISSLGYGLSAMWSLFPNGNCKDIEHIIRTMSINTSKVAGIKTEIEVGGDATFVLWNPNKERRKYIYEDSPYRNKIL